MLPLWPLQWQDLHNQHQALIGITHPTIQRSQDINVFVPESHDLRYKYYAIPLGIHSAAKNHVKRLYIDCPKDKVDKQHLRNTYMGFKASYKQC